jgi:hypothetical protein
MSMPQDNDGAMALLDTLMGDPRTRAPLLNMIKAKNPSVSIPEIDASAAVNKNLNLVKNAVLEVNRKIENDKADRRLDKARDQLRGSHGYTDEGIQKLEQFMVKHNIAEHDIAHKAYEAMQPKKMAAPSFKPQRFFDEEKSDKEWLSNPDAALDRELESCFQDIANGTF